MDVGIREIRNKLSYYLRLVKDGETFIITEHNVPIAKLVSYKKPEFDDVLALREKGLISWGGGKPKGLDDAPVTEADVLVSDMIMEDRR